MDLSSLLGSSNGASAAAPNASTTATTTTTPTTTTTKSKSKKTTAKNSTAKKPKTSRSNKSNATVSSSSSTASISTNSTPVYVKQVMNNENVYNIPISLTKYQNELIEILLQLHRPSLLKYIDNILNNTNGTTKSELNSDSSISSENLSDESLRELLLSNIYQITTHSSLLVNHYMPNKMLLMDTKETLNNGSSKFGKLNEIINGLIRMTDFTDIEGKNIIITASTSKELDLIESTLLGKELQYYRFSGSSIYYQNHGTFNYVNNGLKQNENTVNNVSSNKSEENDDTNGNKKSDTSNGKNSKSTSSAASSTAGAGATKKTKGRKPKKSATANEKKGQETEEISNSNSNDTTNTNGSNESNNSGSSHGRTKRTGKSTKTDEYISRISKNSEVYEKLKEKEGKNKLNIYLILSGQLKNLIINNFNGPKENLNNRSIKLRNDKIDFIISLDPFVNQIQNISYSIPIIKLIPINSIEHISILFNNKNFKSLNEERQNLVYDTILNRNKNNDDNDNNNNQSISDSQMQLLLNWLLNPIPKDFPKDIKLREDIIDYTNINSNNKVLKYNELKNSLKDLNFTKLYNLKNYKFFQEEEKEEKEEEETNGNSIKKIKIDIDSENNSENLISSKWINMTYSEYELNLSDLITRHYKETINSIKSGKKFIELVRNDESKRQDNFETKNEKIGKFYKDNQEIKITVDNLNRNLSKNIDEISKYEKNKEKLTNRINKFDNINNISEIEINEQEKKKLELNDKLKIQQDSNELINQKNERLRINYQESSASAAELSNELKSLKNSNEEINKKLKGPSKELYNEYLNNSIKFNEFEKLKIDKQIEFLKNYCSKLNLIVKERNLLLSNVVNSRSTRHSRSSTPY